MIKWVQEDVWYQNDSLETISTKKGNQGTNQPDQLLEGHERTT